MERTESFVFIYLSISIEAISNSSVISALVASGVPFSRFGKDGAGRRRQSNFRDDPRSMGPGAREHPQSGAAHGGTR
jgi:hypothetical protein